VRQHRRAIAIAAALAEAYPDAGCSLNYQDPFELLVATVLSAQCTDERVNRVTPALFDRCPTPQALAAIPQEELERLIRSTGFFRNKAKNLIGAAKVIVEQHGGVLPGTMGELLRLPGVARKTANVVLGNAFGVSEGFVVDTHVARLARRMGLSEQEDPSKIEADLMATFPRETWTALGHRLIHHGRAVCSARKPSCRECPVAELCPKVGVAGAA
jgi:endonuclease III